MAELPRPVATFFFALDRSGITTSETQAKTIPGILCSELFY
jgi:hypothetical protein